MNTKLLESLIREVIAEDRQAFLQSTSGVPRYNLKVSDSRTLEQDPEIKKSARTIKQLWNQYADHNFFQSLIKIHWFKKEPTIENLTSIQNFLSSSGKDEISCTLYRPDRDPRDSLSSTWGSWGVIVDGRVTLASYDMNALKTGYHAPSEEKAKMYASSGIPRYPGYVSDMSLRGYTLDKENFQRNDFNEAIVDNWKPKALVFDTFSALEKINSMDEETRGMFWKEVKKFGLPILDRKMKTLDIG